VRVCTFEEDTYVIADRAGAPALLNLSSVSLFFLEEKAKYDWCLFFMDDVRRAYAVLGLSPNSTYAAVRRRYRALVKTWHPDRFAADPQAQAEANVRMRAINAAYTTLMDRQIFARVPGMSRSRGTPFAPHRRLTREEIDTMVAAIGSEGPLDSLLGALGWVGSTFNAVFIALILLGLALRVAAILLGGNWGEFLEHPELLLLLGLLGFLGGVEYLQRKKIAAAIRDQGMTNS
jgi:DnaJ domain